MYETLLGLARDGLLNKRMLDREEEILRIAEDGREARDGVNHDRTNNG